MTGWPFLPWPFPWLLARAEQEDAELSGIGGGAPPYLVAVAEAFGLAVDALSDKVDDNGWEPHDTGYEQMVWQIAGGMRRRLRAYSRRGVPQGLRIDPVTGAVSGTPSEPGASSGTVIRLDGDNIVGPWRYMGRR